MSMRLLGPAPSLGNPSDSGSSIPLSPRLSWYEAFEEYPTAGEAYLEIFGEVPVLEAADIDNGLGCRKSAVAVNEVDSLSTLYSRENISSLNAAPCAASSSGRPPTMLSPARLSLIHI